MLAIAVHVMPITPGRQESVFWRRAFTCLRRVVRPFPSTPSRRIPNADRQFPQSAAVTFRLFPLPVQPFKRAAQKAVILKTPVFPLPTFQNKNKKKKNPRSDA